MNARAYRPHLWIRCLLAYIVFAGFVPMLSTVRSLTSVRPFNPYHNFELAWGLMHIVAALVGVVVALWYLRHSSIFAGGVVVLLTMQILFPLLEYRREGFDPRMPINLNWQGYLTAMLVLAVPFGAVWAVVMRRRRQSY